MKGVTNSGKMEGVVWKHLPKVPAVRDPDKFNPFKPYLKTIQILADN